MAQRCRVNFHGSETILILNSKAIVSFPITRKLLNCNSVSQFGIPRFFCKTTSREKSRARTMSSNSTIFILSAFAHTWSSIFSRESFAVHVISSWAKVQKARPTTFQTSRTRNASFAHAPSPIQKVNIGAKLALLGCWSRRRRYRGLACISSCPRTSRLLCVSRRSWIFPPFRRPRFASGFISMTRRRLADTSFVVINRRWINIPGSCMGGYLACKSSGWQFCDELNLLGVSIVSARIDRH